MRVSDLYCPSCRNAKDHKPQDNEVCWSCVAIGGAGNYKESKTNYDRLVSKSPEELAKWLAEVLFHCSNTICDQRCPMYKCCCDQPSDNIEDWLKQEAKE